MKIKAELMALMPAIGVVEASDLTDTLTALTMTGGMPIDGEVTTGIIKMFAAVLASALGRWLYALIDRKKKRSPKVEKTVTDVAE